MGKQDLGLAIWDIIFASDMSIIHKNGVNRVPIRALFAFAGRWMKGSCDGRWFWTVVGIFTTNMFVYIC